MSESRSNLRFGHSTYFEANFLNYPVIAGYFTHFKVINDLPGDGPPRWCGRKRRSTDRCARAILQCSEAGARLTHLGRHAVCTLRCHVLIRCRVHGPTARVSVVGPVEGALGPALWSGGEPQVAQPQALQPIHRSMRVRLEVLGCGPATARRVKKAALNARASVSE